MPAPGGDRAVWQKRPADDVENYPLPPPLTAPHRDVAQCSARFPPVRYGNHSPSLGYRCAPKRRLARQQSSARDPQCGKFAHHSLRARQSSPPFSLRRSGSLVPAPSRQCKSLLPPRPDIPPVAHLARILAGCAGPDRREYWSTSIPPHLSGSRPTRWRTRSLHPD